MTATIAGTGRVVHLWTYPLRPPPFCQARGDSEAVCSLTLGHESDHYCCTLHRPWPYRAADIPQSR